jgi:hypothetical protein
MEAGLSLPRLAHAYYLMTKRYRQNRISTIGRVTIPAVGKSERREFHVSETILFFHRSYNNSFNDFAVCWRCESGSPGSGSAH